LFKKLFAFLFPTAALVVTAQPVSFPSGLRTTASPPFDEPYFFDVGFQSHHYQTYAGIAVRNRNYDIVFLSSILPYYNTLDQSFNAEFERAVSDFNAVFQRSGYEFFGYNPVNDLVAFPPLGRHVVYDMSRNPFWNLSPGVAYSLSNSVKRLGYNTPHHPDILCDAYSTALVFNSIPELQHNNPVYHRRSPSPTIYTVDV